MGEHSQAYKDATVLLRTKEWLRQTQQTIAKCIPTEFIGGYDRAIDDVIDVIEDLEHQHNKRSSE